MPGGSASASTWQRSPEEPVMRNLLPVARRALLGLAAITHAIFAATGKRVRKLPVDTTALKQAL